MDSSYSVRSLCRHNTRFFPTVSISKQSIVSHVSRSRTICFEYSGTTRSTNPRIAMTSESVSFFVQEKHNKMLAKAMKYSFFILKSLILAKIMFFFFFLTQISQIFSSFRISQLHSVPLEMTNIQSH